MDNFLKAGALLGRFVMAATVVLWSPQGLADILVVSSDVATLKPGQQIGPGDRIEIPAGAKVRVLLPSGKTQLITGPANSAVADIAKGGPTVEGVLAKAKDFLATGGADASRPGATRSMMAGGPAPAFAWDVVPAGASGDVCVEQGAQLKLARSGAGALTEATLLDTGSNAKFPVYWSANDMLADWPAALAPRPDAVYQVITPTARPSSFTLRVVEKAQTDEDSTLAALLMKGCRAQARAWLAR